MDKQFPLEKRIQAEILKLTTCKNIGNLSYAKNLVGNWWEHMILKEDDKC